MENLVKLILGSGVKLHKVMDLASLVSVRIFLGNKMGGDIGD